MGIGLEFINCMSKLDFNKISVYKTPGRSPGFLLWKVSTSWRTLIESVLEPLGLTHPQFVVLATLAWLTRDGDRVTQAAVSKMAGLDPNTASQVIKGLEKKNLIKREPSLDGRAKNPMLTTQGKTTLTQALSAVEKADTQFFEVLSLSEQSNALDLFQKLTPK